MSNGKRSEADFEAGSGNVFADLGLEDADELFARAKLGYHVYKILVDRQLGPDEIASLLQISATQVSHLMDGHFSGFTTDDLLGFLKRLDQKVTIRITAHKPGEPFQEIGVST